MLRRSQINSLKIFWILYITLTNPFLTSYIVHWVSYPPPPSSISPPIQTLPKNHVRGGDFTPYITEFKWQFFTEKILPAFPVGNQISQSVTSTIHLPNVLSRVWAYENHFPQQSRVKKSYWFENIHVLYEYRIHSPRIFLKKSVKDSKNISGKIIL